MVTLGMATDSPPQFFAGDAADGGGALAAHFLLIARTSNEPKRQLTAFLFHKDTPGFRVGGHERKMGIRDTVSAELVFEGEIPPGEREKLFLPYYSTKRRGSGLDRRGQHLGCHRRHRRLRHAVRAERRRNSRRCRLVGEARGAVARDGL